MSNEYSIKDIISLFLSKLWLIIIVAIMGGTGAYFYTKYRMPLLYSSHISMYIQSYTTVSEDPEKKINNINYSKQLINTYIEVLKDDAVMDAVADHLESHSDREKLRNCFGTDTNISAGAIRGCLNITSVSDTSALSVSATTKDPVIAADICNCISSVAPPFLQDAVGVGEINTIDTAKVYFGPVAPNFKKNALLGFVAGGVLVVLIIFLIDFFDNSIKDPEMLHRRFKKSIIGEVEEYSEKKRKKGAKDNHTKLTDPNVPFGVVESYKSIRTNIHFILSTKDKKIFAVTSPGPGDGKSTMSANLAIAMAQSGTQVLLIDGDMRKPAQHKIFRLKNKKGLSTAISHMDSLDSCICKGVEPGLDILTSGPIPPNPSELLASESMRTILDSLSQNYGCIIIDTPPLNMVSDAVALADKVAGSVIVVRYAETTTDEVESAMKKVELANMSTLGFILNDVKTKKEKRYGRSYTKSYGYGYYMSTEQEQPEPEKTSENTEKENKEA